MITVIDNPLVRRDITVLRNKHTSLAEFRRAMHRIGYYLSYEAAKLLEEKTFTVETPLQETTGYDFAHSLVLMPVLRAGLALVEPTLLFFPEAIVGHIGLRRNEATHLPEEYYFKMPTVPAQTPIFLLDPMLATGGSICATIERLHLEGFNNIAILAVIAAPEGIEKVLSHYPGTRIITASLDTALNDNAYIIPGLGDAGDRFFGTES